MKMGTFARGCAAITLGLALSSAALAQKVRLATSMGDIVVELDAAKAPKSADNFTQYVKAGHYDGTIFHRVIGNFMIQGGGMDATMKEKPTRAPIPLESQIRPPRSSSSTSRTTTSSTSPTRRTATAMPSSARWSKAWTWSRRSAAYPPATAACIRTCRTNRS